MKIDKELIERIAKNARLSLTEEEKKEFIPQLQEILDSFSVLNEVPVENLHLSFQPFPIKDVMREDKEEPCLTQEEALQNTVLKKNGFFIGPKTF